MGQRGTGYHKATVVHMESLEAKLAVQAAYQFARRALENDGRIDCAEADHLMLLLETAFDEVVEAKAHAAELDAKFSAVDVMLRTDGYDYSPYKLRKLRLARVEPIREALNV